MIGLSRSQLLVGIGLVLLLAPTFVPIEPVLYHQTHRGTVDNATVIEQEGLRIVEYETLSPRAQQLYVAALENDGSYHVPLGQGAQEYRYPSPGDLGDVTDYQERNRRTLIVIERPNDSDLPPPDEPLEIAQHRHERQEERVEEDPNFTESQVRSVEEWRDQIGRYDVMHTRQGTPPLSTPKTMARLASAILGVLAIGIGGYRAALP